MDKERFAELWTALVTNRPKEADSDKFERTNCVSQHTIDALVKYCDGDTSTFDSLDEYFN